MRAPLQADPWRRKMPAILALSIAVLCGTALADTIFLIDGSQRLDVEITSIQEEVIRLRARDQATVEEVPLVDVREIAFASETKISPGASEARLWTTSGGMLEGRLLDGDPGEISLASRLFERVDVDFARLRAVQFVETRGRFEAEIPGFAETRESPSATEDTLFVRAQDGWVRIEGLVESAGSRGVAIAWEGSTRTVPRSRVGAIVFAAGGQQAATGSGLARLELSGGIELVGAVAEHDGRSLTFVLPGGVELRLPAGALMRLTMLTDRISYLSDRDPLDFRETPFFGVRHGYRRDRNVRGGALAVGRVTYEKGLGVHSRSVLEYELDGSYSTLSCVVGIDDVAESAGSVVFRVLLDGKESMAIEATGEDSPRRVRVELGTATRLALEVDFGSDEMDVGDIADWCDAMLVR